MNELKVAQFGTDVGKGVIDALAGDAEDLSGATGARHGGFEDVGKVVEGDVARAATEHQVSMRLDAFGGEGKGFGVFLDGALFLFFGVGHRGGIDDHDVPALLGRSKERKNIGTEGLMEIRGEMIEQPIVVCCVDGSLGDIDAEDLGGSAATSINGKSAGVAEKIENAQALAEFSDVLAIFALIEEKSRLLAFEDVHKKGDTEFADGDRGDILGGRSLFGVEKFGGVVKSRFVENGVDLRVFA